MLRQQTETDRPLIDPYYHQPLPVCESTVIIGTGCPFKLTSFRCNGRYSHLGVGEAFLNFLVWKSSKNHVYNLKYIACSECINNDGKLMETFVDLFKKHHQSCEKPWNPGEWRHGLKMQAPHLLVRLVHKSTCLNNRQDLQNDPERENCSIYQQYTATIETVRYKQSIYIYTQIHNVVYLLRDRCM